MVSLFDGQAATNQAYELPLHTADLADGIYFLKMETAYGENEIRRIVVMK